MIDVCKDCLDDVTNHLIVDDIRLNPDDCNCSICGKELRPKQSWSLVLLTCEKKECHDTVAKIIAGKYTNKAKPKFELIEEVFAYG